MHDKVEDIQKTLQQPAKITTDADRKNIKYYYGYYKQRPTSDKYLCVVVNYINHHGFVITAYFTDKIK